MWDRIEPLTPADPVRGLHRRTLEAIAWKYRTGSPWRDLPDELGSFQTAHKLLLRWAVDGTWERILATLLAAADGADDIRWTVPVDSTVCRTHQHTAGAREKGRRFGLSPTTLALGRSRGGLSTKVHLVSDGHVRPLALRVSAGQAGHAPAFEVVMAGIRVPQIGPGRPRTRPDAVLADAKAKRQAQELVDHLATAAQRTPARRRPGRSRAMAGCLPGTARRCAPEPQPTVAGTGPIAPRADPREAPLPPPAHRTTTITPRGTGGLAC